MRIKHREFKSGVFRPKNPHKFLGGDKCIYRSSWELKAFQFLDSNPKVLKWTSEKIVIPYVSPLDNKLHKYYVDLFAEFKLDSGIKRFLIEVKPYNKTLPPSQSKRKKQTTILHENCEYVVNRKKWESAMQYCTKNGIQWMIMTEKGLYINDKFYEMTLFQ